MDQSTFSETVARTEEYRDLVSSLQLSAAKVETDALTINNYQLHHVVLKNDSRCLPAQLIHNNLGIDVIHDPDNLVAVSASMHSHMHTNAYCVAINHLIINAVIATYDADVAEARVRETLNLIKVTVTLFDPGR